MNPSTALATVLVAALRELGVRHAVRFVRAALDGPAAAGAAGPEPPSARTGAGLG